jgi:CRISPR/Cas system-associated exonuclease Cas4 (RecB family)
LPNGQPEIRGFENFDVRLVRTAELPAATTAMAAASLGSPPVILERARLTEQFDPNTTATALSQFASCPRKYYLGHYLGWNGDLVRQRVNGTGLGAADIGTAVHHLLAGHKAPEAPFEALSLAQTFERSALGKRARKATRGEREWEFTFAVDPLVVRGSIDLWFEDAHGLTIVDYKTDDVSALDAKARAREYHVQIQLYALALERATGKRVASAWLSFLRPDVSVNIPLADGAQNIGALTERFAAAQENLDFPMIPTLACRRCEFYHTLCPAKLTMDAHA